MNQADLFGTPRQKVALSQWFTPMWLARRLAEWVPTDARVLEPACGSGNLIAALVERGHDPERIVACELDAEWAAHAAARFEGRVRVWQVDFTDDAADQAFGRFDVSLQNPPFEDGLHAEFIKRSLEYAPIVVGLFPQAIEFGEERDRALWATRARVVRRAKLPARVKYGGDHQAMFDTVALMIERRREPRRRGELNAIIDEVWEAP